MQCTSAQRGTSITALCVVLCEAAVHRTDAGCCHVLQEAVTLARGLPDAERAARRLAEEAYNRGSNDNISCVVIKFNF